MSMEIQGDLAVATVVLGTPVSEDAPPPYSHDDPVLDAGYDASEKSRLLEDPDAGSRSAFYSAVRMGPVGTIVVLGFGIAAPVWTELLKNRVCLEELHYSANVCAHINQDQYKTQGDAVRSRTADYQLYDTLIASVPAVFFSLLVGAWSDRFGRKLPMIMPALGGMLAMAIISIIANFPLGPAYLLLPSLVGTISGGWGIFFMAMFSYVGDHTTKKNRSMNIVILECAMTISGNAGAYLGGFLESRLGSIIPFYIVAGIDLTVVLYVLIVVRVAKTDHSSTEPSGCAKFSGLFTLNNVKDQVTMLKKERMGATRSHLWMVFVSVAVFFMVVSGDAVVMQIFAEFDPIKWNLQEYTQFAAITGFATSSVAMLLMLVMRKYFQIKDTLIGFLAMLSGIVGYFVYGIAWTGWVLYLAAALGVFKVLILVSGRSLMSAMVDSAEIGKSMSLISSIQAIAPIFGVLIFTNLFARTSQIWPGLCFIAAAFTLIPALATMGYVDVVRRRDIYEDDHKYRPLEA